ncbi:MAG: prephenate dehydratase [Synechocystis sp.]|nr:prephenate dehydratase [Synechocystis sp.]
MSLVVAHLGPEGTNAETVALVYAHNRRQQTNEIVQLLPCPSIGKTIEAVADKQVDVAIVPVENSTEGTVAITFDSLWAADDLKIQQELVLPIAHVLLSRASSLDGVVRVVSHPQALGQCQKWLSAQLPQVVLIPANSTSEAIQLIADDPQAAAIASPRAATLFDVPVLATNIQDYPDNCTRFWAIGPEGHLSGSHTTLAFSVPENRPGALVSPLQALAKRGINLSRLESRPTKRSLGDYLFFMDLEASQEQAHLQAALAELAESVAELKIFGSYPTQFLSPSDLAPFYRP